MDLFEKYPLDKTQIFFGTREEVEDAVSLADAHEETFEVRLEMLELLRQIHYENYSPTDSIQRILEFTQR